MKHWPRTASVIAATVLLPTLAAGLGVVLAQDADPSARARTIIHDALEVYQDGAVGYRRSADFRVVYQARTLDATTGPGIRSTWTITGRADGRLRIEKDIRGEKETFGYDGKKYWWVPSGSKEAVAAPPTRVTAMQLEHLQRNLLLDYEDKGFTVSLGRSEVGSAGLHRVTFLRKGADRDKLAPGDRFQLWFDEKNRLTRLTTLQPSPAGGKPVSVSIHYKDYKFVDGIPVAQKQIIEQDEKEVMELTLREAEYGKEYKPELFKP